MLDVPVLLQSAILIVGFLILLAAGLPIAVVFLTAGTLTILFLRGPLGVEQVGVIAWSTVTSEVMITIPLFVLMGELLFAGGLGSDLFETTSKWLGRVPAGLAVASMGSCMLFGSVCGSSVVTAATIGSVAYPEMRKRQYGEEFACGILTVGGGVGLLIPPSIPFIVYSMITEMSVGKMFMAGVVPGLLLTLGPVVYAIIFAWRHPGRAPRSRPTSWKDRITSLQKLGAVITLIVVVLVSLYKGITTPSEAGAVGAIVAFLLVWLYKRTSPSVIWASMMRAVRTTAMIALILIGANVMNHAITWTGIPQMLIEGVISRQILGSWAIIPTICAVFFVMGMFMESLAVMLLIMPTVLPVMNLLGVDLIWLGVIMILNIEIGMLTPPVGLNLYVLQSVSGLPFGKVARGALPFVGVSVVVLIICMLFPIISTWLPSMMG